MFAINAAGTTSVVWSHGIERIGTMKLGIQIVVVGIFIVLFSLQETKAQSGKRVDDTRLPALTQPVTCELALRYIDDAIERLHEGRDSNLIVIVHMSKHEKSRVKSTERIDNLKKYFLNRGVKRYIVALGDDNSTYGSYDIFYLGELLYSLPIKKGQRLNLQCWAI